METEFETLEEAIVKPGWHTTEFWLSVLVIIAATSLMLFGQLDADDWKWAVSITTGGYALSRGLAKI